MATQQHFPVATYLQPNVIDGKTISRKGPWWSAVLLVRHPRSKKLFIGLYRWQKRSDGWKRVGSFKLWDPDQVQSVIAALRHYEQHMQPGDNSALTSTSTELTKDPFDKLRALFHAAGA